MLALLTSDEMRKADHYTISQLSIPEMILMEHAALAVVQALADRFGKAFPLTRGLIIAGPGNNGGDALASARILIHRGISLTLVKWGDELSHKDLESCDWIVDGLFGTGLKRPIDGKAREIVSQINAVSEKKWIVAIDVPSGLNSDTGHPMGIAVVASQTVVLGFYKKGLVTAKAADYTGRLSLATILIPREIPQLYPSAFLFTPEKSDLPIRKPTSHKGNFGHVFIWAGEPNKQGATCIASRGALRAGTGLVTVIGANDDISALRGRLIPEIMTQNWEGNSMASLVAQGVLILGPGMGTEPEKWALIEEALGGNFPLVLDADALTLLSNQREKAVTLLKKRTSTTIMTPHPKEAARLLGKSVETIEANRYDAHAELVKNYHCDVILKGKGSITGGPKNSHRSEAVRTGQQIVVNQGDTGLSKGGSGDLLAGVLAALLAQGITPERAMPLAAFMQGRASELLTQAFGHERSSLASEIAEMLPIVFKELQCLNTSSNP